MLHLGSELISSDGIAFYELIKNSLDARSTEISVDVLQRLPFDIFDEIIRELGEDRDTPRRIHERYIQELGDERRDWRELKDYALCNLVEGAPNIDRFRAKLERTGSQDFPMLDSVPSATGTLAVFSQQTLFWPIVRRDIKPHIVEMRRQPS